MSKKRILITGVSGMLGNNLAVHLQNNYEIIGTYLSHPVRIQGITSLKCDLTDSDGVKALIKDISPDTIIHCASLTNVDQCEEEKDRTKLQNVNTVQNIVDATLMKTHLIYISTDSVYNGIAGNFSEESEISPLNYYGQTKYEGEKEAIKHKNTLILRTNIFGWNITKKQSLGEWILHELQSGNTIRCFKDAYFSSIYTFEFSRIIETVMRQKTTGLFNCGSRDYCSKYDFAVKLAEQFNLDKSLILPISIDNFPFKARRGKNMTLNTTKLEKAINYRLPTMDHSVERFYEDWKSKQR